MEYLEKRGIVILFTVCSFFTACNKEENPGSANQRFDQSMEWNASHPYQEIVVPADDYTILTVADVHVGGTANLDLFIQKAKRMKPAAVVMVGDFTSSGKAEDLSVFEEHLPVRDSLNYFLVAGNHDLYSNGWPEFYKRFGSSTYLFTVKTPTATDLFICLETGGFTLGSKQLSWLKSILEIDRNKFRRCYIFTHVNYFRTRHTFSTNPYPEEITTILAMFFKDKVDMAVTGHDHKHSFETFGLTTYIVMDALEDDYVNAGYFKLAIKDGTMAYSFEKL